MCRRSLGRREPPGQSADFRVRSLPPTLSSDFTDATAAVGQKNAEACISRQEKHLRFCRTTGLVMTEYRACADGTASGHKDSLTDRIFLSCKIFSSEIAEPRSCPKYDYSGQIFERLMRGQRKGCSSELPSRSKENRARTPAGERNLRSTSFREGDAVGMHEWSSIPQAIEFYLATTQNIRREFAEGSCAGSRKWRGSLKWLFEFRDIWRELSAEKLPSFARA